MKNQTEIIKKKWNEKKLKGHRLTFKEGQVLFYEGHFPYGFYILNAGAVLFQCEGGLCSKSHHEFWGEKRVIGLEPFLKNIPYSCTCLADSSCELVFISKTECFPVV